jgi:hypothetical protein
MKKNLIIVYALAGLLSSAQAGLILSDSFTYPDTNLTSTGVWVAHSAGGANAIGVTNGQAVVRMLSASAEDDHADLSGQPYLASNAGIKLYSSYSIILSNDLPSTNGTYFSHFMGTNTGAATDFGARVFVTRTNSVSGGGVADGFYRISIGNGAAATNDALLGQINVDLQTNVVYKIVTRFVPSTGIATIWLNPNLETDPSASGTDPGTLVAPNPFNVYYYAFRQASGGGESIYVDNLKVGTIFNDVAGTNTSPAISQIPDQNIPANTSTGPLAFAVSDAETPATGLSVTASSSNSGLVPNNPANLTLSGTSTNRTINVTPASGQQGSATITLTVSDTVNTSFTTFVVLVGAPSIGSIPDQTAVTNTVIPAVLFTVTDPENNTITLRATSSNTNLITTNGISFGTSGSSSNLTLTPVAGQIGVSTITVFASDGFSTNSTSFKLTMRPVIGVLYDEDFLYTGFDIPNGLYNATGGSGAPWSHVSPVGSALYQVQVTNGWAYLGHTNDEDLGAALIGGPYDGSNGVVFYMSFPVAFSFLPSNLGDYFVHLKSSAADSLNFRCKVFAATNGTSGGKFRLGIANQQNSPAMLARDLSLNQTNTVVVRYNSGTGQSVLWVNPRTEGSAHATATDSPGESTIGGVALREPGSAIGDMAIGHLKIGTSFTDVASIVPPPSPETLQAQIINGELVLSWSSSAFQLAAASVVTGPYNIVSSSSPYTNSLSASQSYFRLVYP